MDLFLGKLSGNILHLNANISRKNLEKITLKNFQLNIEKSLVIDGSQLQNLDSAGLAALLFIFRLCKQNNFEFELINMPKIFFELLDLYELNL